MESVYITLSFSSSVVGILGAFKHLLVFNYVDLIYSTCFDFRSLILSGFSFHGLSKAWNWGLFSRWSRWGISCKGAVGLSPCPLCSFSGKCRRITIVQGLGGLSIVFPLPNHAYWRGMCASNIMSFQFNALLDIWIKYFIYWSRFQIWFYEIIMQSRSCMPCA